LFTLCTLLKAIICCSQLNTRWLLGWHPEGGLLVIDAVGLILCLLLLALFTFLHTITFYHSIRLILCLQQTGEIDNLIVSWSKVLGRVVCRFHVAASEKLRTSIYLAPLLECREASEHQPSEVWLSPTSSINLGFTTEGRLAAVLIIPSSWGSQRSVIYTPSSSKT
jgi:hypothetical protein